jgi:DNA-binding SARP family transcriptional activator
MWRLRCAGIDVLEADQNALALCPEVRVDIEEVSEWADRVVSGRASPGDVGLPAMALAALDLLPGIYEDWVGRARDWVQQMVVGAIEVLSRLLVEAGRYAEAVDAALTAVSVDPLRESAQRALIWAHLAEGNRCEALRSYTAYEDLLIRELGDCPSDMSGLLLPSTSQGNQPTVLRNGDFGHPTALSPLSVRIARTLIGKRQVATAPVSG